MNKDSSPNTSYSFGKMRCFALSALHQVDLNKIFKKLLDFFITLQNSHKIKRSYIFITFVSI